MWSNINAKRIYINKGISSNIKLKLGGNKYITYPLKKGDIVDFEISFTHYFEAPVYKDTEVGSMKIKVNGEIIDIVVGITQ